LAKYLARESKEKKDCQAKNSYMISRPTTCDSCKKLAYCECHLDDKKHPVCESVGEREQREEEEDHKAQRTARTGKKAPRERGGEEGSTVDSPRSPNKKILKIQLLIIKNKNNKCY